MSADNWTICPACKLTAIKAQERAHKKAEEAYGKAPAAEYLALLEIADKKEDIEPSLREDWEIGTDEDGTFVASYRAICKCGFKFDFKETRDALHP